MIEFLRDTGYLLARLARASARMPVFVVISVVQPVVWIVLFGQLFQAVTRLQGFTSTSSYIQYLTPGVAIMTALFGSAYSGMGMLTDLEQGWLDRLLVTPVRRGAVIMARVVIAGLQVTLQAAILVGVGVAMGARPRGGLAGLALVLVAGGLLAASIAGVSNALALLTRRQELVIAAMNFLVLPMTFLSSMMMSPRLMPTWIQGASRLNPVDWAVQIARAGFEGTPSSAVLLPIVSLAGLGIVTSLAACGALRHYLRSR